MFGLFRRSLVGKKALTITGAKWFNVSSFSGEARTAAAGKLPLTWEKELAGTVTILHFWDYSSPESVEWLESFKSWWETYEGNGFSIIGIHTPQYSFAEDPDKVEGAILRLHLDYPVVNDPEYTTWKRYGTKKWPRVLVVDAYGTIQYDHEGAGGFEDAAKVVSQLLASVRPNAPALPPSDEEVTPPMQLNVETATAQGIAMSPPNDLAQYHVPPKLPLHHFALSGWWATKQDRLVSGQVTDDQSFVVHCLASNISLRLDSEDGLEATLQIIIDSHKTNAPLVVSKAGEYALAKGLERKPHMIAIIPLSGTVSLSALSFS